jgi:hypothetical protein
MADRRKDDTGGRGGEGPAAVQDFSLDDFEVVEPTQELSRAEPAKYQPLVEKAIANLGRKIERTDPVMEPGKDGQPPKPKLGENGKPIREPHRYTKAEALQYEADLRATQQRMKLTTQRLSLRINSDPSLSKANDNDSIRMQFYVISLDKNQPAPAPTPTPPAPANVGGNS